MPFGSDPVNDQTEVMLESIDAGVDEAQRCKFTCRFLTGREEKKHGALVRELLELWETGKREDRAKAGQKANEAILMGVRGWTNVRDADGKPLAFSAEALEDLPLIMRVRLAVNYPVATDYAAILNGQRGAAEKKD